MMIAILELVPRAKERDTILGILSSVEGLTRVKPGCLGCGIYEKCGEERTILYVEQWRSKEELYRHIQSELYFRVLTAMDLTASAPEIRFHNASDPIGMELVRDLRVAGLGK